MNITYEIQVQFGKNFNNNPSFLEKYQKSLKKHNATVKGNDGEIYTIYIKKKMPVNIDDLSKDFNCLEILSMELVMTPEKF